MTIDSRVEKSQGETDQQTELTDSTSSSSEVIEAQEENIENKESEVLLTNEYMEITCMKIEKREKEDPEMYRLKQILLLPKQQWKTSRKEIE